MAANDAQRPTYTVPAIPSDTRQAFFLGNPVIDNLVSCLIAIDAELWAVRRRMKVLEAVLAKNGISPQTIEQYAPSADEKAAWEADRQRFIELTLGPLGHEGSRGFDADLLTP
ncbi:MAG: hypothetical protein NZM12_13810 [Steroidobacteraceae bacterium]|nr:hypothetical protein [Steroidobacteraceae bacterium]MDW8258141.1 hypothetical protein [Gammaproteobacteria bacterium]